MSRELDLHRYVYRDIYVYIDTYVGALPTREGCGSESM